MNHYRLKFAVLASVFAMPGTAQAGDVPIIAAAPAWVIPPVGVDLTKVATSKSMIPILDTQALVDGDLTVEYVETAVKIANQGMLTQFGTISLPWQPQHGDLTVHKLQIVRGAERIDLLKSGPGFTVLRREANLEKASIDGQLTATMPVQGLRVGDIVNMAASISVRDKTLGGHGQVVAPLVPEPVTMDFGRARLVWPEKQALAWKSLSPDVTPSLTKTADGMNELTVSLPIAKPAEMPKNVPLRFVPLPIIEASNFADWQAVATVMAPLYRTAGLIADGSDLAKVVDRIKAAETDPLRRAAAALRVAQDDVRYQFVALGNGNYVPQKPAETYAMRSGDCKAKTLLLLAMLDRLGIKAEPVLANTTVGDRVASRLPSALAFDHVLVRAEVGGETLYLDGTRVGDRLADIRDVPRFGSVLPLRETGAALVTLPTRANQRPSVDITIVSDASAGLTLPSRFTLKETFAGPRAQQVRAQIETGSSEALVEYVKKEVNRLLDSTTILTPKATYDAEAGTWGFEVSGLHYPDWDFADGHFTLASGPQIAVTLDADRSKSKWRELPALIADPWTARSAISFVLPERARAASLEGTDAVTLDIPAVSYRRAATRHGLRVDIIETSGETGAEIAPGDLAAARKAIDATKEHEVRIVAPAGYLQRWDEVALLTKENSSAYKAIGAIFDQRIAAEPKESRRYTDRAWYKRQIFEWAAADADYGRAIAIEPSGDNYRGRANLRLDLGDLQGGLADARKAYDLDTSDKDARQQLVDAFAVNGQFDEALDLIDSAPDPMTDEGSVWLSVRAELLAKAGRYDDSIALLDSAIGRRPSLAQFHGSRCYARGVANKELNAAVSDCDKAIELASDPANYYDSRALVHMRAARWAQAKADLDAALAITPEFGLALFKRGIVSAQLGDKAAAAADLAAARKLYPAVDTYYARFGIKP